MSPPPASRVSTWLQRAGMTLLGVVGGLTWLFTGDWGTTAGMVMLPAVLGLFFLAAGVSGWRESRRRPPGTAKGPAV
jgi:hypothetical protein